jgi:hypothetical protein
MDITLKYLKRNKLGDMYLEDPRAFRQDVGAFMAVPDTERQAFFSRPWITKTISHTQDKGWVLLGSLAAFHQSELISPKKKDGQDNIEFRSNSVNGQFLIYETRNGPLFLKIVLNPTADALECDSVILRAINQVVSRHPEHHILSKHFSTAIMSTQLLITLASNKTYSLDMGKLFGAQADQTGYYGAHGKGFACVPAFATNAATPGISLGHVIGALHHAFSFAMRTSSRPEIRVNEASIVDANKKRMMTFLQNGLMDRLYSISSRQEYMQFTTNPAHLATFASLIQQRLLNKLATFFTALLKVGKLTFLSHGDLHSNNVLYDMYDDCLVAIDYGRSYVYLKDDKMIQDEHSKIMSPVPTKQQSTPTADNFYTMFGSPLMRNPVDVHNNIKLKQYNVMNDIAGLSFNIWTSLCDIEELGMQDRLQYKFLDVQYNVAPNSFASEKYLLVAPDLAPFVNSLSTLDLSDVRFALYPGLLWFALYLHALISTGRIPFTVYTSGPQSPVYYAMDYDDIVGEDCPIFYAGQFMPEQYAECADALETSTTQYKFFQHLEIWIEKVKQDKMMTGGYVMTNKRDRSNVTDPKNNNNSNRTLATSWTSEKTFSSPSIKKFTVHELMDIYQEHRTLSANRDSILNSKPSNKKKVAASVADPSLKMGSLTRRKTAYI